MTRARLIEWLTANDVDYCDWQLDIMLAVLNGGHVQFGARSGKQTVLVTLDRLAAAVR